MTQEAMVAVDKFSVSLPEDLVAQVDDLAREMGLSRSGLIREATTRYVVERAEADREISRQAAVGEAIDAFERIASEWGSDERSGLDYLHEVRGEAPESDVPGRGHIR